MDMLDHNKRTIHYKGATIYLRRMFVAQVEIDGWDDPIIMGDTEDSAIKGAKDFVTANLPRTPSKTG